MNLMIQAVKDWVIDYPRFCLGVVFIVIGVKALPNKHPLSHHMLEAFTTGLKRTQAALSRSEER